MYGADAIAGVVNFVLKKNFEGVQINAQSSISEQGDGTETSVNGFLGASFADGRGSVMIGADYSKRDIIFGKDRDWVVRGWNDPGTNARRPRWLESVPNGDAGGSERLGACAPAGYAASASPGPRLCHRSERQSLRLGRPE